jgi:murein DD-endopeptidase MepM/ murein hydrolase activator NlpD
VSLRAGLLSIVFFSSGPAGLWAAEIQALPDLKSGPVSALRAEISANLRATSRGRALAVSLRFLRYKVKPGDHFYRIVTSTHQDPDTLASLNSLVSPEDVEPGMELLIPNARGVFTDENSPRAIVVPELPGMYFRPGSRFHAEELRLFRGEGFVYPLAAFILTSNYGNRLDPFSKRTTFHGGLDMAAPEGTSVAASRSGVVRYAASAGGYGRLIVIDHGHGYKTLYGHLKQVLVRPGQAVRAGEKIGLVGSTGRSTGPHLHFELRKDGRLERPRMVHGELFRTPDPELEQTSRTPCLPASGPCSPSPAE